MHTVLAAIISSGCNEVKRKEGLGGQGRREFLPSVPQQSRIWTNKQEKGISLPPCIFPSFDSKHLGFLFEQKTNGRKQHPQPDAGKGRSSWMRALICLTERQAGSHIYGHTLFMSPLI